MRRSGRIFYEARFARSRSVCRRAPDTSGKHIASHFLQTQPLSRSRRRASQARHCAFFASSGALLRRELSAHLRYLPRRRRSRGGAPPRLSGSRSRSRRNQRRRDRLRPRGAAVRLVVRRMIVDEPLPNEEGPPSLGAFLVLGGAAGNRTRVLRHSLKASPCAVRYVSTRISRSREQDEMTIPVAV